MQTIDLDGLGRFPRVTMGVMQIAPDDTVAAIHEAMALGYRSFDTAPVYGNEAETGEAFRNAPVARDEIFLTTKLWNQFHGYDDALAAFDRTMGRLGVDVLDLYLIHWPVPTRGLYVEAWKALVRLKAEGRIRAIGVSNFLPEHLDRILDATGVVPAVNQVELYPSYQQAELRAYHARTGIATEAWSPLGRVGGLPDPVLSEIASAHNRSMAQVTLRWMTQRDILPVVKARSPANMRQNIEIFDFTLTDAELARIDALDTGTKVFEVDPRTFEAVPGRETLDI